MRGGFPRNSLRGSAAQCPARRLCRTQHVYDGKAVCFCVKHPGEVGSGEIRLREIRPSKVAPFTTLILIFSKPTAIYCQAWLRRQSWSL